MLELMNLIAKGKKISFTGEEVQKLLANDGARGDNFGYSVAISGDGSVLVLGATGVDDIGSNSGAAYVFTKQSDGTYVQSQKLLSSDGAEGDSFGRSVAISSDVSVVVVGAYGDDDKGSSSGSAYVFTKQSNGSYAQSQKLLASDGAAQDYFGFSVSVSSDGTTIVVGAYQDDDKGENSGSAYVFTKQSDGSYVQSQKLVASDGFANDRFGYSVAISGDGSAIVVGAYFSRNGVWEVGSAYVFTKQSNGAYVQSQKLLASDGTVFDYFGISVAISSDGSVIVVGADHDDAKGMYSGSAYAFTKQSNGSYVQSQKLVDSDGGPGDYFGFSVSVNDDGGAIVVGSYKDSNYGSSSGSACVFTKQPDGSYLHSHKLLASDGGEYEYFGYSVTVSGDGSVVVAGSRGGGDNGSLTGAAYVFK